MNYKEKRRHTEKGREKKVIEISLGYNMINKKEREKRRK